MNQDIKGMVNGQALLTSEFERQKQYLKESYNQRQMEWDEQEVDKVVLEQMIGQALLVQEAEKEGIKVDNETIEQNVERIKSQFTTEEQFYQALESQNLTLEQLEHDIYKEARINGYLENNISSEEIKATNDEISFYYEQYKASAGNQAQGFEEVKPQIEQIITQQKVGQAIGVVVEKLKAQSEIETYI